MSQADFSNLAYSIGELADKGPIRRSSIYNQIAAGRLRARKIGRRTIILDEDWRAFLAGTPIVEPAKGAATLTAPSSRPRGRLPKLAVAVANPVEASTVSTTTRAKTPTPGTQAKTGAGS
jgi:hypothetical protein